MTSDRAAVDPVIDKYKLGMLLFIASEATFFVFLIVAYLYFRGSVTGSDSGPTAATSLDPMKTGLFSVALIGSSVTLWLAGRSLARARHTMVRVWLLVTVVLGGAFLVGQGMEYARLLSDHVTISRNLFGATFFTLTGFHGLHVLLGLIMLSVLLGHAVAGSLTGTRSAAVEAVSLYWHFVDAVWLVIFSIVYLWIVL
jgi:heme/copper-type cytochrome/quinol oxidase subunit 3